MTTTNFQTGTVISSDWLNDVDQAVYQASYGITGAVNRTLTDKLSDFVSVKDFGAVGDGVTDDTAAIQAALNSGASFVDATDGVFLVSDEIVVPRGVSFVGHGAGSVDSAYTLGTVILQSSDNNGVSIEAGVNGLDKTTVANMCIKTSVVNSKAGVYVPFNAGDFELSGIVVTRENSTSGTGNRFTKAFDVQAWVGSIRRCWAHKAIDYGLYMYGPGGVSGEINAVVVDQFRFGDVSNTTTGAGLYAENAESQLTISNFYMEGSAKYGIYLKSCETVSILTPYLENAAVNCTHLKIEGGNYLLVEGGYWNQQAGVQWHIDASGTVRSLTLVGVPLYSANFNDVRGTLVGCAYRPSLNTISSSRISYVGCYQEDSGFSINSDLYNLSINGGDVLTRSTFVEATLDFGSIAAYSSATIDVTDAKLSGITATGKNIITATPDSSGSYLEAGLTPVALPRDNSIRFRLINTTASPIDPVSRVWRFEVKVYA